MLTVRPDTPALLRPTCKVINPSKTPARIESTETSYKNLEIGTRNNTEPIQTLLTPGDKYDLPIEISLLPEQHQTYLTTGVTIEIEGRIKYTDIFGKFRYRKFARRLLVRKDGSKFYLPGGIGLNDEEDWGKDNDDYPNSQPDR